jgi:mitochondrial fission protein ELM1
MDIVEADGRLPLTWVVTDGKAGMESQCLAVARRLGLTPLIKRVRLRAAWRLFSPWALRLGNRWALSPDGDQLQEPLPDLLIASGRHSVAASRAVAMLSGQLCLRVQIQNPGISARHFDLVAVPRHDRLGGANVVITRGAPHAITTAALAEARERFASRLAALPRPRIAVLLGGDNGAYRFGKDAAQALADRLSTLVRNSGGSLLVTPSRRTGASIEAIFRASLADIAGEIWDRGDNNPYLGYLAFADHILVTADSINMVCEAAAAGVPVQIVPLEGGSAKFRRFHADLQRDGITRPFEGSLEHWQAPSFDDSGLVAERVAALMRQRGWILPASGES